ncbi:MAG TPA: DUF3565 domain-containing protein [Gemmatimonadales bacterium]|nr:DUF3565 domain-containing protein [Gemmatimonadales bacterium]
MRRRITGFHRDLEGHWVAELECGHGQHVRHDPPWQVRPWVLDEATRRDHLGTWLDCRRCDEAPPPSPPTEPEDRYTDARLSGLCEDGASEAATRKPARGGTP